MTGAAGGRPGGLCAYYGAELVDRAGRQLALTMTEEP
jgi:hypothetical protein